SVVFSARCRRAKDDMSLMLRIVGGIVLGYLAINVSANPVKAIPKLKESSGRVLFLDAEQDDAVRAALPTVLRPLFTVSINTGLRWSEQAALVWRDVDMLTGIITVRLSKNGATRRVPMNSVARAAIIDVASRRQRPDDPTEPGFRVAYRTTARALERA